MQNQIANTHYTPASSKQAGRALMLGGLWLGIGFVGASAVAAGLLQLLGGDMKPTAALALAVGGGLLAAGSWWRGGTFIDRADRATAVATNASPRAAAHAAAGA